MAPVRAGLLKLLGTFYLNVERSILVDSKDPESPLRFIHASSGEEEQKFSALIFPLHSNHYHTLILSKHPITTFVASSIVYSARGQALVIKPDRVHLQASGTYSTQALNLKRADESSETRRIQWRPQFALPPPFIPLPCWIGRTTRVRRERRPERTLDNVQVLHASSNPKEHEGNAPNQKEGGGKGHQKHLYRISIERQDKSNTFAYRFSTISDNDVRSREDAFTVITTRESSQLSSKPAEACRKQEGIQDVVDVAGPSRLQRSGTATMDNAEEDRIDLREIEKEIGTLLLFMIPVQTEELLDESEACAGRRRCRRRSAAGRQRDSPGRQDPRRRNRSRPPTRRRQLSEDSISEVSNYEVEDVEYEPITDKNVARGRANNWRVFPKYELTEAEAAQQEVELYRSFTLEERNEGTRPAKEGEAACCVCYDNAATRVVIPCGHHCLCYQCARNLALNRTVCSRFRVPKLCPICQAAIAVMPRLC
ncbi:hypothetical protein AAG570_010714 [Ranatra chinensis]|uniref:RING-type domain-containing protein n=1 Tax=Ranatra chinensis TaxID=642074 RepID=A0ABD0YZA1_9HEMI